MAFDFKNYLKGNEGMIPNWDGQGTAEMIGGKRYAAGNEGMIPDNFTGGVPTKQAIGQVDQNVRNSLGTSGVADSLGFSNVDRQSFDPSDPEQVMSAQKMMNRMGVGEELKEDGMMGPKTQEAWRTYVANSDRMTPGQDETYRYDENQAPSKGIFGGLFGRGYQNADKAMGGILPGGYKANESEVGYGTRGERTDQRADTRNIGQKAFDWLKSEPK